MKFLEYSTFPTTFISSRRMSKLACIGREKPLSVYLSFWHLLKMPKRFLKIFRVALFTTGSRSCGSSFRRWGRILRENVCSRTNEISTGTSVKMPGFLTPRAFQKVFNNCFKTFAFPGNIRLDVPLEQPMGTLLPFPSSSSCTSKKAVTWMRRDRSKFEIS